MNKYKKNLILILLLLVFIFPKIALAKNLSDAFSDMLPGFAQTAGYNEDSNDPTIIISTIIQVALSLIGVLFLILMVYGGYLWMTAAGSDEKLKRSQNTITAAVIGLVIVVAAYAISSFVVRSFQDTTLLNDETVGPPAPNN